MVRYGHEAVVRLPIEKDGVDIDAKDNEGRTPLICHTFPASPLSQALTSSHKFEWFSHLFLLCASLHFYYLSDRLILQIHTFPASLTSSPSFGRFSHLFLLYASLYFFY